MINIFKGLAGDPSIDKNQFKEVAQMIQVSRIQSALVGETIRTAVQRNRQKYRYEAEIYGAKTHRKAARFGYNSPHQDGSATLVCPCCSLKVNCEQLPICYSTTDLSELRQGAEHNTFKVNTGVAMFFLFLKTIIMYFIIKFLITDAFNLYSNVFLGGYCQSQPETICTRIWFNYLAITNKQNHSHLIFIHDILNLVTIVLSIVFFLIVRKRQYEFYDAVDNNLQTENDYTIMVSNIPTLDFPKESEQSAKNVQFYYRKHLEQYFQNKIQEWLDDHKNCTQPKPGTIQFDFEKMKHGNGGQLRSPEIVRSISLCYNLSRLQTITKTKQLLIDKFLVSPSQKQSSELEDKFRFSTIPKKIDFLNDCQIVLNKQFANDNSVLFNMTHFVGCAFVSFQYQHYRDYILLQASSDNEFLQYNGNILKIEQAAHPSQVFWPNLRISQASRHVRTILSFLVLLMVLIFAFLLLSGAEILKEQFRHPFPERFYVVQILRAYWALVVSTIFIMIINKVLTIIIHYGTEVEKHTTRTNFNYSLIIKLVTYQFINTALIYYAISIIKPLYTQVDAYTSSTGLVITMSWVVTFYVLIQLILNIIHFPHLIKKLKLWWKYRHLDTEDKVNTFQIRLNKEFQYPEFDLAQWYGYFIVQAYILSFYSYLIPIIVPIMILSWIVQFWLVKIILFRRSSLYYTFDIRLSRHIRKIFEGSILVFAIGNFLFALKIKGGLNFMNISGLIVALLYVLFIGFVPEKLERRLLGQYETCEKHTYDDCVADGKFQQTYWKENPATCLVNESDITHKNTIYNPVEKIVFATMQNCRE